MSDLAHWFAFVMNVIMVHIKDDVSFVEVLVSVMHITAKNAQFKRKM